TFDPIHNGHLHIAYKALDTLNLDKVIFVPAGNPPLKESKKITDANLRYELVKLAIEKEKRFDISSYEIDKVGISYTYDTVKYFKELENNTKWYFIVGADCLMELDKWKNVDVIMKNSEFAVYSRPGYEKQEIYQKKKSVEDKYGKKLNVITTSTMDISSTKIKEMVKKNLSIKDYLPENVYYTIEKIGLYK
ncbi:MAG: nicotinate-nucleotide adenylyltransferase, partial [Clostridiaceae bacterium]